MIMTTSVAQRLAMWELNEKDLGSISDRTDLSNEQTGYGRGILGSVPWDFVTLELAVTSLVWNEVTCGVALHIIHYF